MSMSQAKLQAAKELIDEKEYGTAKAVLETLTDNATAIKWLARLNEMSPPPKRPTWEYCEIGPDYDDDRISAIQIPFDGDPKTIISVSVSDLGHLSANTVKGVLIVGALELGKDGWEIFSTSKVGSGDTEIRTFLMKRMVTG